MERRLTTSDLTRFFSRADRSLASAIVATAEMLEDEHAPLAFIACARRARGEQVAVPAEDVIPAETPLIRVFAMRLGDQLLTEFLHELNVHQIPGAAVLSAELAHARRVLRCQ